MDNLPRSIMDEPATYRVRVCGRPGREWVEAMVGEVTIETEQSEAELHTSITVELADQASLLGFINALYNLGYAVVSLDQISPEEQARDEGNQVDM